jgi:hypothetical protein
VFLRASYSLHKGEVKEKQREGKKREGWDYEKGEVRNEEGLKG